MEVEKYKQVAYDCAEILQDGYSHKSGRWEAYEPAEYQMGLTLAIALYLKAMFPGELEEVFRMHCESLRLTLEELDAKSHADDMLDVTGLKLDGI